MDDLPPGQVAHPTGDLDGHVYQILLGNRLQEPRAAAISPFSPEPAELTGLLCPCAPFPSCPPDTAT